MFATMSAHTTTDLEDGDGGQRNNGYRRRVSSSCRGVSGMGTLSATWAWVTRSAIAAIECRVADHDADNHCQQACRMCTVRSLPTLPLRGGSPAVFAAQWQLGLRGFYGTAIHSCDPDVHLLRGQGAANEPWRRAGSATAASLLKNKGGTVGNSTLLLYMLASAKSSNHCRRIGAAACHTHSLAEHQSFAGIMDDLLWPRIWKGLRAEAVGSLRLLVQDKKRKAARGGPPGTKRGPSSAMNLFGNTDPYAFAAGSSPA